MSGSASPAPRPYTPAFDRGEARYFHGRDDVLKKFRTILDRSKPANAGTTMMIQAAPGAGKTALLTECARIAGLQGWQVAEMEPIDLLDANELHNAVRSVLEGLASLAKGDVCRYQCRPGQRGSRVWQEGIHSSGGTQGGHYTTSAPSG